MMVLVLRLQDNKILTIVSPGKRRLLFPGLNIYLALLFSFKDDNEEISGLRKIKFFTMKAATISEIKQELSVLPPQKLAGLCLRLARYKNDNKELLTYLLFEASDETAYLRAVKDEIDEAFNGLPKPNLYLTKKSLRKILRSLTKYIRHTGSKQAEAELLIYFCSRIRDSGIPIRDSPVLVNLYRQQLKKIHGAVDSFHEDLRYDYHKEVALLEFL